MPPNKPATDQTCALSEIWGDLDQSFAVLESKIEHEFSDAVMGSKLEAVYADFDTAMARATIQPMIQVSPGVFMRRSNLWTNDFDL